MSFLLVRHRSGVVQVVLAGADVGTVVETLPAETMIAVKGVVTGRAQAPGGVEVTSPQVRALSAPAATSPVISSPVASVAARQVKDRVEALGGQLWLASAGAGITVQAALPLHGPQAPGLLLTGSTPADLGRAHQRLGC